jgi:hypothetical protein
MLKKPLPLVMLAVWTAATGGCSRGEPRGDVSGEVTFEGKAVETGLAVFEPLEAMAAPRSVPIQDGKFSAYGAAGLKPGAYRVRLTAADPSKMGRDEPKGIHSQVDVVPLLPAPWNAQSKLSVDVKPGKNVFHFRGKKTGEPTAETKTD